MRGGWQAVFLMPLHDKIGLFLCFCNHSLLEETRIWSLWPFTIPVERKVSFRHLHHTCRAEPSAPQSVHNLSSLLSFLIAEVSRGSALHWDIHCAQACSYFPDFFYFSRFMPPDDPLGRHGPTLSNFLSKKPVLPEKKWQPCPYGGFLLMLWTTPASQPSSPSARGQCLVLSCFMW